MVYLRKYNVTLDASTAGSVKVRISLRKAGLTGFAVGGDVSFSAGDVLVSKDGGGEANIGSLPAYANGQWEFVLTGTELSAKFIHVRLTNAAIDDDEFGVETYGNASAMYPSDFTILTLPNSSANGTGGVPVIGAGTNQFKSDASARMDAIMVIDNATTVRNVNAVIVSATGNTSFQVGSVNGGVAGTGSWNTVTPPTAQANAAAVWNATRSGFTTAGSFGAVSEWSSSGTSSGLTKQDVADAMLLAPAGAPATDSVIYLLDSLVPGSAIDLDINTTYLRSV